MKIPIQSSYKREPAKVVISKERSDWEILRFLAEFTLNEVNVLGMTGIQWKLIYHVYYNNNLFKNILNLSYFLPIIISGTVKV